MIKKAFLEAIYDAANMQRWNDKISPVELRELDKQAHKMIIAYVIGKFDENSDGFSWVDIIEGGIFEFLQRLVLTDLKPQIFNEIKKDAAKYELLNEWVYKRLRPKIGSLGEEFCRKFQDYFSDSNETLCRKILNAAHFSATQWEFNIIERTDPDGYEIRDIKNRLRKVLEEHYDLEGMRQLVMYEKLRNFVDLCGQLRFQVRWSHIHMFPRTSVLGHMLIVAMIAYLFSLEIGACERRLVNNYFTGLFHDLPEVLTRDISSPVKGSVRGLGRIVKKYENKQMKQVYELIPKQWRPEIQMFTKREFKSVVTVGGDMEAKCSAEISKNYNQNEFNPRDGELILAIDHLAAFIEAYLAIENGIKSEHLTEARATYAKRYTSKKPIVAGIDFASIYSDFVT